MRPMLLATGTLALCGAAFAQSTPAPAIVAADVRPSNHGVRESELYLHRNRLELHGVTMLHLITAAYEVPEDKVFGGPNWLDTDRFEVVAQTEGPLTAQTWRPMLQSLLADRFQLQIRKEDKPEPVFALLPTKKVLLKESSGGDGDCQRANADGYLTMTCHNVTMAVLAEKLPRSAPNYFDHPVVDRTGLKGSYDVTMKWSGRGQIGAGDPDHPSISLFDYFEKQLGIKVERQTRPAESMMVMKVNEAPSPNPPGTAEKLPPPLTEFEVAEIRPSKPDTKPNFEMKNGRIQAFALTMKDLISFAYNLDDYMLPGGEKWLDSDRFDIIAKADPTVTDGTLQAMLRTLLEPAVSSQVALRGSAGSSLGINRAQRRGQVEAEHQRGARRLHADTARRSVHLHLPQHDHGAVRRKTARCGRGRGLSDRTPDGGPDGAEGILRFRNQLVAAGPCVWPWRPRRCGRWSAGSNANRVRSEWRPDDLRSDQPATRLETRSRKTCHAGGGDRPRGSSGKLTRATAAPEPDDRESQSPSTHPSLLRECP